MKITIKFPVSIILCALFSVQLSAQESQGVFPGADERSPSRSQYFSWINNTNEGPQEEQTLINLAFFKWLNQEYGMILDIYAFDAGAIDGKGFYGSMDSERFKNRFPNGFDPIYKEAKSMETRLGVWGGPDGFGDTKVEEMARHEMMVSLCRDYEFELFKFDGVCGGLRPEKQDAFVRMMEECRKYSPDLILLNHRLNLYKGNPHATTELLDGRETYIDVFWSNDKTAPHHRGGILSREVTPNLIRLTEDCGVCISACIDYWEDDLILQAFNRCLILAPELYGNPWFLRDDEYPKLARIFNLHRKYRDILVDGMELPNQYGPSAVARGDDSQRFLTLRNLTWNDTLYTINLDKEIGLKKGNRIEVRQYHPTEKVIGYFKYGEKVDIPVSSFRSSLIYAGPAEQTETTLTGIDYHVIQDVEGKPIVVELLGMPGTTAKIELKDYRKYKEASFGGGKNSLIIKGKKVSLSFPGKPLTRDYHRKIADLEVIPTPNIKETDALFEATAYAGDNNALEVRSINRSGWSSIPQVRAAQDAFFNQDVFINRGLWDKYLFDGDMKTGFWQENRRFIRNGDSGSLRIDMGKVQHIDVLKVKVPDYFGLEPYYVDENSRIYVSSDLEHWERLDFLGDTTSVIQIDREVRYLKINTFPRHIVEVEGYLKGKMMDRSEWRASNLFHSLGRNWKPEKVWSKSFTIDEIAKGSYISIAINGEHGHEKAFAAARIDGKLVGCPDRAISYPTNGWETTSYGDSKNYTYYLPLEEEMEGKKIEVFVMAYDKEKLDLKPEVWISANPVPFEKIEMVLKRR